jgi:hypothetical protein
MIILIILMVAVPLGMVFKAAYDSTKEAEYVALANKLAAMPVAHEGTIEYVYTRSYMEKVAKDVEHDINGYFSNKEDN